MDYRFVVSPEFIKSDLSQVTINGETYGVYSGMSQVLSGGPNGSSIMTGLTIPIMLTDTTIEMGYYSPFDGAALQSDVTTNFVFSSTTANPYLFTVYNTSSDLKKFLEFSQYTIDWGDNSPIQNFNGGTIQHTYPLFTSGYTITMKQTNPFGVNIVKKDVKVPYTNTIIFNPVGKAFFQPLGGSWSATPISYDYIFSGDAVNTIQAQETSTYETVPFTISGNTTSRVKELSLYGNVEYMVGVPVIKKGAIVGAITDMNPVYTAYTIENANYYDYVDGQTIYFENSSGLTQENITAVPITKNPLLMKSVDQPQITSDVYIERGKNSVYEPVRRIGEVDNVSDLISYGYGYFVIEKKG